MPLAKVLAGFQAEASQCDALIANAHQLRSDGTNFLSLLDRKQVAEAALLNFFVGWEAFLEGALVAYLTGAATLSGRAPVKYASPPSDPAARAMLVGTQRYFDFGNLDFVRKIAPVYFDKGYPFEPALGSIAADLGDLRTMRNATAHITSSTQAALEALALRIFGAPHPGIDVYSMMTRTDPRSTSGITVFAAYQEKVLAAADLVARG